MKKVLFLISFMCSLLLSFAVSAQPQEKLHLTKDNVLYLETEVTDEAIASLIQQARDMDNKLPPNEPIYLVETTPGGSIEAGIELIQNLQALNRPVHTITLLAASMGFHVVQGLGTRYISESGTLMSHRAKGSFAGEFPGQLNSRYKYYLNRVQTLEATAIARTNGKVTEPMYKLMIQDEYWCQGEGCVKDGFADKVVLVVCDKSMDGYRKVVLGQFKFLGMDVKMVATKAVCPMATGIVKVEVAVDNVLILVDGQSTPNKVQGLSPEGTLVIKSLVEQKMKDLFSEHVITY